ncbi:hypothetical protein HOLleu_00192 [Holothuria leucospilota]|uniref:Helitron helicase-like domain-containing protein n=1 Tax=Holothuria leucospilota TaxID=206669 RepID=A0A9Q1CMN7_HOLLE|nr:hypothetical protein HOLleu_00192 [Holothuria leucospilota]
MAPDSDDEWTEVQNEDANPAGSLDTMLAPQFDNDSSLAYCFAPSEGGQPRSRTKIRVHYSSIYEGFRVFRTVRGSPPYWEKTKKELFAMIRQLGIPTWFISFSAAETRWVHLRILGRTVHNKEYSDGEMLNMTWHEKSELIQSDPVTCARHFDYMIRRFINVLLSSYHPVGEIADHFYRVEFQQRGSPHIHMLAWVSNAPVYENASNTEVASFIDKYITCKKPTSEHLALNLQTHSHAKTCRKKREGVCRFGFPIPSMPRTMILTPLENVTTDEKDQFSALYDKGILE